MSEPVVAQPLDTLFIDFSCDKLKELCERIDDCLGRLTLEQVWARSGKSDNSMGNLVLHLCGNVSQWIGSGVGGRIDHRDRDAEFAARGGLTPAELEHKLNGVISEAVVIIRDLSASRLAEVIRPQGYTVTVLEAVYHVVEHFAQHTAQIMFATKLITGDDLGYYKHLSKAAPGAAT
jgi:uncharacterized damage-inducible protein DinB